MAPDAANPEDLFPTHLTIPGPSAAHSSREKETQPRLSLSPSLSPWFLVQGDDTHTYMQTTQIAVAAGKEQGGMERAAEESRRSVVSSSHVATVAVDHPPQLLSLSRMPLSYSRIVTYTVHLFIS